MHYLLFTPAPHLVVPSVFSDFATSRREVGHD